MVASGIVWFCRDFARSDAEIPTRIGELSLNVFKPNTATSKESHNAVPLLGLFRQRLHELSARLLYVCHL